MEFARALTINIVGIGLSQWGQAIVRTGGDNAIGNALMMIGAITILYGWYALYQHYKK